MKTSSVETSSTNEDQSSLRGLWQETSLCLAPSNNGAGWGVYAARSFSKGDIVEVAPLFLRFEDHAKVMKETIFNNYHYEYWAWNGITHQFKVVISFGYNLYYNHAPNANIEFRKWGDEPDIDDLDRSAAVGYFALRDIEVGEELVCDYGDPAWFEDRSITLIEKPLSEQPPNLLESLENYRSKLYSGIGIAAFQKVMDSHREPKEIIPYRLESIVPYMSPMAAAYENVVAKERVDVGETLEYSPALVLSKAYIQSTLLEPFVVSWNDLDPIGIETVSIHHEIDDENFAPPTQQLLPVEETALFPLAGSIGLLARSLTNFNTRMFVEPDEYNEDSFCLRIVATKAIEIGEVVKVHLPRPSTTSLVDELALTGQPLSLNIMSDSSGEE